MNAGVAVNVPKLWIDDQHDLAAHPVRIGKPESMVGAKIVDGAIGCTDSYEVLPCLLERLTTCRSECQMVEVSALKHCRFAARVLTGRSFDRMQP